MGRIDLEKFQKDVNYPSELVKKIIELLEQINGKLDKLIDLLEQSNIK